MKPLVLACSRSCDVCSLVKCEDNHARCGQWARDRECSANPAYMAVACRKSCGKCGDAPSAPLVCQEEGTNYQGRLAARVQAGVLSWPACSAVCSAREGLHRLELGEGGHRALRAQLRHHGGILQQGPGPQHSGGGEGLHGPGVHRGFHNNPISHNHRGHFNHHHHHH